MNTVSVINSGGKQYIINPETGRTILVGGQPYNDLVNRRVIKDVRRNSPYLNLSLHL